MKLEDRLEKETWKEHLRELKEELRIEEEMLRQHSKEVEEEMGLYANVILKNGDIIRLNPSEFQTMKNDYLLDRKVSIFAEAIIPHNSIDLVLRLDKYTEIYCVDFGDFI